MKKIFLIIFVGVCIAMPISAQINNSPEDFVKSYWAALPDGDVAKIASMIHPKALASLRKKADGYADALLTFDKSGMNLRGQFGVTTKEEFQKLSDADIFKVVFQMISSRPGFSEVGRSTRYDIVKIIRER